MRVYTAIGEELDLVAADLFGKDFVRSDGETDAAFRHRMIRRMAARSAREITCPRSGEACREELCATSGWCVAAGWPNAEMKTIPPLDHYPEPPSAPDKKYSFSDVNPWVQPARRRRHDA